MVTVKDDGSPITQGTAIVTVTVNNLNEPPVVSSPSYNLAENSPSGAIVGMPDMSDPETGQTHIFEITSGNEDGAFIMNASTGEIKVVSSTPLDFETQMPPSACRSR